MRTLTHVVVVCHQLPPWTLGGLAEYGERFLRHLRAARPELRVTVHTMPYPSRGPAWLRRRLLGRGKGVFALALLLFQLRTMVRLCGTRRAGTVVAVHDWQAAPVGLVAAWLLRFPVVYHIHSDKPDVGSALGIVVGLQRLMGKVAARVVVPTPEMRDWLGSASSQPTVRVVPHGHEPGPVPADTGLRAAVGFPPDARLLVFAGRLSRVKGIDVLLRAMPEVLQLHPAARLFVLGVGFPGTGQDAAVDRLVAELDLTDVVHVYHSYLPRERVYQHFQAATACVFPSTFEPFGLVALEAMSFGVPVVLGPGFSRTIAFDGAERTALRLARPDPKELCCALTSILDGDSSVVEAARRGQRHVERNFSWRSTVQSTLDVYQEALACRQAPGTDRSDRNATTTATAPIGGAADRTGGPSRVELPARAGHGAAAALPDGGVPAGPAAP